MSQRSELDFYCEYIDEGCNFAGVFSSEHGDIRIDADKNSQEFVEMYERIYEYPFTNYINEEDKE